jgi:hypothetical protein
MSEEDPSAKKQPQMPADEQPQPSAEKRPEKASAAKQPEEASTAEQADRDQSQTAGEVESDEESPPPSNAKQLDEEPSNASFSRFRSSTESRPPPSQ